MEQVEMDEIELETLCQKCETNIVTNIAKARRDWEQHRSKKLRVEREYFGEKKIETTKA